MSAFKIVFFVSLFIKSHFVVSNNLIFTNNNQTNKFEIKTNINLDLFAVLFNLSEAGDYLFENNPTPRASLARVLTSEFKKYKNHNSIKELNKLLNLDLIDFYDIDLSLYYSPLPDFNKVADFSNEYYIHDSLSKRQIDSIFYQFEESVKKFYYDTNFENQYQKLIKKLRKKLFNELNFKIPYETYIFEMEKYYGLTRDKYSAFVSLFAFNGIGRSRTIVDYEGKKSVFLLLTSDPENESKNINIKKLRKINLGFQNENFFREICLHEIGHTFFVESIRNNDFIIKMINSIEYLFTDSLKSLMRSQGYADWKMCFEEHLVRLGELKVEGKFRNEDFVISYRNECLKKRGFIYLELMEEIFIDYEENRDYYSTINLFIPNLITRIEKSRPKI